MNLGIRGQMSEKQRLQERLRSGPAAVSTLPPSIDVGTKASRDVTPRREANKMSSHLLKHVPEPVFMTSNSKANLLSPGEITRNLKMGTVQPVKAALGYIDDSTINDHIRRIMHNRPAITDLAHKYGLYDNQKVD
jgi:hypothetical protein